MKKFKLAIGASLITLLTTGCTFTSESPEQLIERTPVYNESRQALYDGISKSIPKARTMILPSNSKDVGKINEVDLNNDKNKEIVVFQKKDNFGEEKDEVGFLVFTKDINDTYTDKATLLQKGDSIEYANFYDLNNDGIKEIILLVKSDKKTNMYIYQFKDNKIKKVCDLNPNWIKESSNLTDMKVNIGLIDDDDKLDILMIHYNPKNSKIYASLGEFNEGLEIASYVEIENVKNLENLYTTIGNVANKNINGNLQEIKGIILDIPIIKDNNYITQILYVKDDKLQKAFKEDDLNIAKPYFIPVKDINGDEIIDIPIVKGSGNTYTSRSSALISWYKWNGKQNNDSSLSLTNQIYYNYQFKFEFLIPKHLENKIYVKESYLENKVLFKFYYNDMLNFETKQLFTISVVSKSIIEDKKSNLSSNEIIIGENNDYKFTIDINNIKELDTLNIDKQLLIDCFSPTY